MNYSIQVSLALLWGYCAILALGQEQETPVKEARVKFEKTPLVLSYVEVNDHSLLNAAAYRLENGRPLIDLAIIFAANINRDEESGEAVLFCNENVQFVLDNHQRIIRPLQEQGIRVSLSILGNHQGLGLANFQSREQAKKFAAQVAKVVKQYGLDGVDLDDEFAKYNLANAPEIKADSLLWFLEELRKELPDKLISYYFIGPSKKQLSRGNKQAGDFLDYAWQAYYSRHSEIEVPGLGKDQLSFSALDISKASASKAAQLAKQTKEDKLGAFLIYNLQGKNQSEILREVAQGLYGQELLLSAELVNKKALAAPVPQAAN